MLINNQAKWVILEQHLGERLRGGKNHNSNFPSCDLNLGLSNAKKSTSHCRAFREKYDISRRSRLSDSIYSAGMKHRLTARLDFWV